MEPFLGQIMMFAGNFAPRGWAFCNGQFLAITNYQALFSLLGTTYGGDGHTSFGLPDLRGRVPCHAGSGQDLTPRRAGQRFGVEEVTLNIDQMPMHSHGLYASSSASLSARNQNGGSLGRADIYAAGAESVDVALSKNCLHSAGGDMPHENVQPTLCINFIIALDGQYPPRP